MSSETGINNTIHVDLANDFFDSGEILSRQLRVVENQITQDSKNGLPASLDTALHLLKHQVLLEIAEFKETESRRNLLSHFKEGVFSLEEARFFLHRIVIYKKQLLIAQKKEYLEIAKKIGTDFFSTTDTSSLASTFFGNAVRDLHESSDGLSTHASQEKNVSALSSASLSVYDELHSRKSELLWIVRYLETAFFRLTVNMDPEGIVNESLLSSFQKEKHLINELLEENFSVAIFRSDLDLLLKTIYIHKPPVYTEVTDDVDLNETSANISSKFCEKNVWFVTCRVIDFTHAGVPYRVYEGRHIGQEGENLTNGLECYIVNFETS